MKTNNYFYHFLSYLFWFSIAILCPAAEWVQVSPGPHWSPRGGHTSVVFQNKIWIIGGGNGSSFYNDVWSSADGVNWTEVTASAPWSPRFGHGSVMFNNKIWVVGGAVQSGGIKNDVWSSADGVNWTQASASGAFPPFVSSPMIVFNGRMWILGCGSVELTEIWSSADGVNWQKEGTESALSDHYYPSAVAFNNKMWFLCGNVGSNFNDAWYSSDGANWTQVLVNGIGPMWGCSAIIVNDLIVVSGGSFSDVPLQYFSNSNQVFSSSDGVNWNQQIYQAPQWSRRRLHTSVVFDNKVWIMGGTGGDQDPTGPLDDIWYIDQSLVPVEVSAFSVE